MLPFENRPWAKPVAATMIVIALILAISIPLLAHHRKTLDPPIIVGVILLLLAIIPPNIVILRHRRTEDGDRAGTARAVLASRPVGR